VKKKEALPLLVAATCRARIAARVGLVRMAALSPSDP
jgi:hypothetical protein